MYLTAIETGQARGSDIRNVRINLAQAYVQTGQGQAAIGQYQALLASPPPNIEPWRLHLAISEVQAQLGDMAQARLEGELALQAAPEADKATVQGWLDRLP